MPRPYLTQVGYPLVERGFNGLTQVTRIFDVNAGGMAKTVISENVLLSYGTADEEYKNAILVKRQLDQSTAEKSGYELRLIEVYQEFRPGEKVSVGEDQLTLLPDGRTQLVRRFVSLAADAETVASTVGTVLDGRACSNVVITKAGLGAEVVETYISAGKLAESDSERNNGRLLLKTLSYFNQIPPTPFGYVLVDQRRQETQGVPTYTYEFAKGDGEVSRKLSLSQNGTVVDGTVGVSRLAIVALTAPAGTEPVWASVAGYAKIDVESQEAEGHRVWRALFAKGSGLVSDSVSPAGIGLRRVTYRSLGSRIAPTGIVVEDASSTDEGHSVFTVSAIQTDSGGANPTVGTWDSEDLVEFTYPGRAKPFVETYSGRKMLNVYESPPVTARITATVKTSYTTTPTVPVISPALWNPVDWAVMRAQWRSFGDNPHSIVRPMPGYRSVSATPVEETCSSLPPIDLNIFGSPCFGGSTARIVVVGGPSEPDGNTYTLEYSIDPRPAFVSTSGVRYHRVTQVVATIPAQAALPV